jgi:hypothetical protein
MHAEIAGGEDKSGSPLAPCGGCADRDPRDSCLNIVYETLIHKRHVRLTTLAFSCERT